MVLGIPVKKLIDMIGHDGSTKLYAERPQQEGGFHEQECIEAAQKLGFACTPIEIVPQMVLAGCTVSRPVWFPPYTQLLATSEETNLRRFYRHLQKSRGVLTGLKNRINSTVKIGHAVAWGHNEIYDPQGEGFIYSLTEASDYGFNPRVYWKIQEIKHA